MRPDKGYDLTEKELKALEKRIYDSYKEAYDGLTDIIKEYFAKFADRDASEKARLDAGDITEEQYKQWRIAQIGRGKRFEALRDKVAERMTNANAAAVALQDRESRVRGRALRVDPHPPVSVPVAVAVRGLCEREA